MKTNTFYMKIKNKLALLVYFTCNTYYKEPVLELNLKNKEFVKIINLHTLLTLCRHDDDNQHKIPKWVNGTYCRHAGTPFVLHVAADKHFPTNFCQQAASASPKSCTELRGNFTGVSLFSWVWSIWGSRHLLPMSPFEHNLLTFHCHVHKSIVALITFTMSSWSKIVRHCRQNSGTERNKRLSHHLHTSFIWIKIFNTLSLLDSKTVFTFSRRDKQTNTFTRYLCS